MENIIERKIIIQNVNLNVYGITVNNSSSVLVNKSPFGNCQNWSIKYFNILVDYIKEEKDIMSVVRHIKNICGIDKPFLIVDLNEEYYKFIKDFVQIHKSMPYENANKSRMRLCIIDTRK